MNIRELSSNDMERVRELAESALTTSYALSPQQIETLAEEQFGEERLSRELDDSDAVVRVADNEEWDTIVGVVVGEHDDTGDVDAGEVRWLFVDPEHRGEDIGQQLFEAATEALRERGAEQLRATALESNTEGHQFFERFGFEETGRRQVNVGDESLVQYVYAESSSGDEDSANSQDADTVRTDDLPNTESDGGETTVATDSGRVYLDLDAPESGTEDAFFPAYTDETYDEQFGYYCSNCGSLDTSMGNVERIECSDCGNTHASRSTEEYDDSYL